MAVSNDTTAGVSADGAWDSAVTVSHVVQEDALKASGSPLIGVSETEKTHGIYTAGYSLLSAFLRFRRGGYFWIFVQELPGLSLWQS